ncbi:MAG: hypothetical protein K2K38_02675 [Clostridia bacterium]|nr:hypothetical protein [Clostridia bacterium]
MASKKKFGLNLIFSGSAIVFAIITIILLCAPAMTYTGKLTENSVSMASVAFGNKDDGLAFSFLIFLPYLLLLAGIVLNVLNILGKGGKILPIVATVCYVVGAILFFLVMQTFCIAVPEGLEGELKDAYIKHGKELITEACDLGLGAIFSGVLSLVSAGLSATTLFVKNK